MVINTVYKIMVVGYRNPIHFGKVIFYNLTVLVIRHHLSEIPARLERDNCENIKNSAIYISLCQTYLK